MSYTNKNEHKSGPCPNNRIMFFKGGVLHFRQPYVCPTGLSIRHHTPFVRHPAERTKMVTIGASLNKYRFKMSLFWTFWKARRGLNVLRSGKSFGMSSASVKHKVIAISFFMCVCGGGPHLLRQIWLCDGFSGFGRGSGDSLFKGRDRENSLGGERGGITFELCWGEGCLDGDG